MCLKKQTFVLSVCVLWKCCLIIVKQKNKLETVLHLDWNNTAFEHAVPDKKIKNRKRKCPTPFYLT